MATNDRVIRLNEDGTCEVGTLAAYPVVTSADNSLTVTPVADPETGEINYQLTNDECADFDGAVVDYTTFKVIGCSPDGKASASLCELLHNIPEATTLVGG